MRSRVLSIITFVMLFLPSVSFALFLGPYTGSVIDSQTGEPVEGASVLVYWEKRIYAPPSGGYSELIEAKLVYTDKKGRYEIPRVLANLGLIGVLESTNVVIYQPGCQAYIERIWADSGSAKPVRSFKERDNIVKLDRIPPNFNYKKHHEEIRQALPYTLWAKDGIEAEEFLRRVEWEGRRRFGGDKR